MSNTATWLKEKVASLPADTTVAIIATENEIKAGELSHFLGDLVKDTNFMADFKMSGSHWLYYGGKRVVIVYKDS